jgi:hypothetical protein
VCPERPDDFEHVGCIIEDPDGANDFGFLKENLARKPDKEKDENGSQFFSIKLPSEMTWAYFLTEG